MNRDNYIKIFKQTGALLEGHFVLTSGRHSPTYFQCAKVLQYPEYLKLFSSVMAAQFNSGEIDVVISPAVGGIVIGTDVGRALNCKSIFAERAKGEMTLRRGFQIESGQKVLVVEDVITTGGSVKEVIQVVENYGGEVIGVAVIVDRSGGEVKLHPNQFSIVQHEAVSYEESEIPEYLSKIPTSKPGSRRIK